MTLRPLARYIPVLDWGRSYNENALSNDLIAVALLLPK